MRPNRTYDIAPPVEPPAAGALAPYLRALRSHPVLVLAAVVAAVGSSLIWMLVRPSQYEATAQMLVTPAPADDPTFLGLPVVRESPGDPTRTIQTAVTLVESAAAADRTAASLGSGWTSSEVLDAISIEPQGQSNILAVTGAATSPEGAARLTNEFVAATLGVRAEEIRKEVTVQIERLQARLAALRKQPGGAADEVAERLNGLQSLQDSDDPTLSLTQAARVPVSPIGTGLPIILLLAALAGFAIGSAVAVLSQSIDWRIRDERDLGSIYPLPVLARVPVMARRERRAAARSPWVMPASVREAFRTLLAQLDNDPPSRVVLITSASSGDGKTTSAINLAMAMAATGDRVILLDLNLRKPDVAEMLHVEKRTRPESLLEARGSLGDHIVPAPGRRGVWVLPVAADGDLEFIDAITRRLPQLIEEARTSADWVVIDTAALGEVSDALAVAHAVDAIVVVARPGNTDPAALAIMRELLERAKAAPTTGLLVIAGPATGARPHHPQDLGDGRLGDLSSVGAVSE